MKAVSTVFALIVLVLWLGSLAYITLPAAPAQIRSMLPPLPSPPMGNIPTAFLGVLMFLLSIIVIAFWAGLGPDSSSDGEKLPATAQKQ